MCVTPRKFSTANECGGNGQRQPQLHQLKQNLLHAVLEKTNNAALFKQICGAANRAAELAWATAFPLLVFPCLFDEMVQDAWTQFQHE